MHYVPTPGKQEFVVDIEEFKASKTTMEAGSHSPACTLIMEAHTHIQERAFTLGLTSIDLKHN